MSRHKSLIITLLLAVVMLLSSVLATAQIAGEDVGRNIMRMAREKKTGRKETPPAKTAQETTAAITKVVGDELLNILPANCLACIRINNLDTTLGAVDEYITGVSSLPISMAGVAKAQLGGILGDPTLGGVNSQGDFAVFVTVLPGNNAGADMMPDVAVGMLIPVTGPEFSQRIPDTELPGTNYALIMLDAMESITAVRKHLLSSSFAAGLTAATARQSKTTPVWGYVNIAKAVEMFGPMAFAQLDQVKEMMTQAGAQPPGPTPQANAEMAVAYLDFIKQYAEQLDSLSLSITPEPDTLQLSLKLAAKPNTELAGLLVKDPSMRPGYRLAGFLNSPAAINIVAKTNKPLFTKLNALSIDLFTQAIGDTMTPAQIQNWKAMMAGKAGNMGQEAAISFSFASGMPPVAIKGVAQVPDPKAALDQVNTEMQLANEMYKSMGLGATVALEPELQRYKGVQIHALKFDIKAPPEASEEEKLKMESMFGSDFNIKFAAAGSFMLVGVGPDADKDLRGLIDQALSGRVASPTGDIKAAMAAIPNAASTDFVASVNVIRLLSGVGAMMSAMPIPGGEMIGMMFSDLDMPTESCLALAGKADGGAATLQIVLPKQHLLEIAAIAANLQGAMGGGGGGLEPKTQEGIRKEQPESKKTSPPAPKTSSPQLKYTIVKRKMLNDALVISVTTAQFDHAKDIATELVNKNKLHYMVRVFFYKPEQTPGKDLPAMRYEWTKSQGLVKSFDTRVPAPRKDRDPTLPKYEVLFRVKLMHNGRVFGEVLATTLSRNTSAKMREQTARAICKQERLEDIDLYSTRDAYEANSSASYLKSHPDALKKGFLGSLKNGKFIAGEAIFP